MRWSDIEAMNEMTLAELRRVPGFPQPRGAYRLNQWFKRTGLGLPLLVIALAVTWGVWSIPWFTYGIFVDKGEARYLEEVKTWWFEAQQEAELQEMIAA